MIIGAHSILYSTKAEADRAFLRDVLKFPHVDVGEGWLIFGLPPSEVAVHPSDENDLHEFYLMCDDVNTFVAEMEALGVACAPPASQGWGVLTYVTLPGGGKVGVYEPRHARPETVGAAPARSGARAKARAAKPAAKGKAKGKVGRAAKAHGGRAATASRGKSGRGGASAARKKTRRA